MANTVFDLTGKRALVTGSSRGLGLSMARGLAQAGATILLNGTNRDLLAQREDEFRRDRLTARAYPFDVTRAHAVEAAIQRIQDEVGPIDVLVNNAGTNLRGPLLDYTEADWQATMDLNLKAAWLVAKHVAPAMIRRRAGKIINIASLSSYAARPTIGPYNASKAGLAMLTKSMAVEWAEHNVQVNAIAPGYFKTDLTAPLAANPEFDAWVKLRCPAHRWGDPAELNGLLIFLASDASSYLTGQLIAVDGGWTANL